MRVKVIILSSLFLLTLIPKLSFSNEKIDSLLNLLQSPDLTMLDSADVLSQLGYEYWTVDPQKSIKYGRQSLKISVDRDYHLLEAFSYRVIGVAYWALGDYPIALQNMLQSLELYQNLDNQHGIGGMQMNIGLVYSDQGSYEKAKQYFRAGLVIFDSLHMPRRVATSYTKIATVLAYQDSLNQARDLLFKAIELHRENGFQYGLAEAYNRLGIVYRELGDLDASLDYLYRSRDRSTSIDDFEGLAKCYGDIGFTKIEKGDFISAKDQFQESITIANRIGSKKWKLESLRGLSLCWEETGNSEKALYYFKKYQSLKDSVLSERAIMAVANLQEEYQSRDQLRELQASKERVEELQRKTHQKNIQLGLLSFGGLLAFITLILGIRNYRLREANQKSEIENRKLKQQELEQDLEISQRELTSYALNFIRKNELLSELKEDLSKMKSTNEIVRLRQKIHQAGTMDRDWEKFRMQFDRVHGSFNKDLLEKHPDLSSTELKHCSLIRINLSVKECASVLGISPDSAKTARHRIRKKLDLATEDSIYEYLLEFGS